MLAILSPLASLLGVEVDALIERLRRRAVIWGIAGALVLVFACFLLVAANSALAISFGPVVAPLMIAGAALAIALIVFLVGMALDAAQARKEAEERRQAENTALMTSVASTALPILLNSKIIRTVALPGATALLVAYLLNRKSGGGSAD